MSAPLLQGFPPVVDGRARVLILGSFFSAGSLSAGQYYANPRNAFGSIISPLGLLALGTVAFLAA